MDDHVKTKRVPTNFGPLADATSNARSRGNSGVTFEYWVKGNFDEIKDVTFTSDGDETSLTIGSTLAENATGRSFEQARLIKAGDLSEKESDSAKDAVTVFNLALDNAEVALLKVKERQLVTEIPKSKTSSQRRTIMVMSGKGGVGKSTVALNLALSMAAKGKRVGLVDVDIHGPSIPTMLNLKNITITQAADGIQPVILGDLFNLEVMSVGFLLENDDDPVIWRGPLKNSLIEQFLNDVAWGPLDYLFIDCPPGTGDEPLSVAQQLKEKAETVLVTTPQQVSVSDVARSVNFSRQMKMNLIGIIENMGGFVCPNCKTVTEIFRSGGGKALAEKYKIPYLGSIPIDPSFGLSGDAGLPYVIRYQDSPITEKYSEISDTIEQMRRE